MKRLSLPLIVGLFFSLAVLSACGEDDEPTKAQTQEDGAIRYCNVKDELDRAGQEAFSALQENPDTRAQDYQAAERALIRDNGELLDELQEVAPKEIQKRVEVLIGSLRERAGLGNRAVSPAVAREAENAVAAFERKNCNN